MNKGFKSIDQDALIVEILDGQRRTEGQLQLIGILPPKLFMLEHAIVRITKGDRPAVTCYARPVFSESSGDFICSILLFNDSTPKWILPHVRRATKMVDREIKRLLAEKAKQARSEVR